MSVSVIDATSTGSTGTVMVSGNMPAFSVWSTTATSTASGVFTKITFDTKDYDTNNNFASSRFTPTVAGYYQFNLTLTFSGGSGGLGLFSFYKNGARFLDGPLSTQNSLGNSSYITGSGIIYCNGSTDYVEVYGYQTAGTQNLGGASSTQKFTGCLLRAA